MKTNNILTCPNCNKSFLFDEYNAHKYHGRVICPECFNFWFGYCNECGELFQYSEMNDDIVCKTCEKGGSAHENISKYLL